MKKTLAMLLAALMVASMFAGCSKNNSAPTDAPTGETNGETGETLEELTGVAGQYTYRDSVPTLASNWNPHTYQTKDDSYPADYIRTGLYTFFFNDEKHPVEGKNPYEGYVIIPEMAASLPVDVTETVKAEHPEFKIPESATAGYAYTIDLNPLATWEDGTPINADTYVESMKRLLMPELLNYRATDYYAQSFSIAGAEYYANQGHSKPLQLSDVMKKEGLADLQALVEKFADAKGYINWKGSFNAKYDFEAFPWTPGSEVNPDGFTLEPEDKAVETPFTVTELAEFFYRANVASGNADDATAREWIPNEIYMNWTYPSDISYDTVGLYKTGDYQITLVLGRSLAGFNLLYNLTSNWLVKPDLYDSCIKQDGSVWSTNYNTSVDTTSSYGPYKLVSYQSGKAMRFEKNDKWYGYTDGKHNYVDPDDGQTYDMYQTTAIDCQVVEEAATNKLMFLKGQLMTYGLQADDFATYRSSEFCHASPAETIFFLILNGHAGSITKREAAADFDKKTTDLETMMLKSFHQALGLTYDRDLFAATISPARSAALGIIGDAYIYDPISGARYRDTEQAKQVLCDFYSVNVADFASLDDAVDSITGYDPAKAKEFYKQAFDEALEKGYITDDNGDGISDQTVTIEYCISADSDFMTKTIDYLNEKVNEVTADTPFAGKVAFKKSAPYGTDWSNKIKGGLSDTVLGGWTGSRMDPFGLTDLYTNPAYQYDAAWYDATKVDLTIKVPVNGTETEVTMSLKQWSDALNGQMTTVNGVDYNFGDGIADVETRLDILAAVEGKILESYNYLPMLQDGGMSLLSQQAFYVVEEYNPVLARGGIQYLKYNYDDAEWAEYVNSQGGMLKY